MTVPLRPGATLKTLTLKNASIYQARKQQMYRRVPPDKLINFLRVKYFNTETKIDTGIATFIINLDKSLPKSFMEPILLLVEISKHNQLQ